jgi:ATP-dependent RNA helicase DDX46/PRP5
MEAPAAKGEEEKDDYFAKQKRLAEKKELKPIDHMTIDYQPFRKDFYIETKEIAEMTE